MSPWAHRMSTVSLLTYSTGTRSLWSIVFATPCVQDDALTRSPDLSLQNHSPHNHCLEDHLPPSNHTAGRTKRNKRVKIITACLTAQAPVFASRRQQHKHTKFATHTTLWSQECSKIRHSITCIDRILQENTLRKYHEISHI